MSCSNCFNGCSDIKSDQCIKYTGVDVPVLGIVKGDSLSYVEQALITFLTSTLDGTGIKPDIPSELICDVVEKYLPDCGDITIVDLITALIEAVCDLQTQITTVTNDIEELNDDIEELNNDYDIGCLEGITVSSGTHDILQIVITTLCAIKLDVLTNYAQIDGLDVFIQAYLNGLSTSTKMYSKMLPHTAVEYYGPTVGIFDGSGAGIGIWEKIYLCNGVNNTPDLRGRVPVGRTDMGANTFPDETRPGYLNNPYYTSFTGSGNNFTTLSTAQLPSHNHSHTHTVVTSPHSHLTVTQGNTDILMTNVTPVKLDHSDDNYGYKLRGTEGTASLGKTSDTTVVTSSISTDGTLTGSGNAHSNIQPVLATYYVIYIP